MTTYTDATRDLPPDAECSSSFGNPGEGGYVEYWRTPDGEVWTVSNGPYDAIQPLDWRCRGNPRRTATAASCSAGTPAPS